MAIYKCVQYKIAHIFFFARKPNKNNDYKRWHDSCTIIRVEQVIITKILIIGLEEVQNEFKKGGFR
nr:MAG: hypothetical protein DIU66_11005 [Bacillota bacterium]